MKSVIQNTKECYICERTGKYDIHEHHIFFGPNRKWSEKYGMKVCLCGYHHNLSSEGVHNNRELDLYFKRLGQRRFEELHSHEEFMQIFGKNYLLDDEDDSFETEDDLGIIFFETEEVELPFAM